MQFNIAQLLKESTGARRRYVVAGETAIADVAAGVAPVHGQIEALRTDRGVLVVGDFVARLVAICSRCLEPVEMTVGWHMEEEFFASSDVNSGAALPPPDDPATFTLSANHELDLTEAVRQYAALAVPMKPLCRDDCAGLCPVCGQSRNSGACACPPTAADPRWARLAALGEARRRPS